MRDAQEGIFISPESSITWFLYFHKPQSGNVGLCTSKSCALGSCICLFSLCFFTSSHRNRIKAYQKKNLRSCAVHSHYSLYFKVHKNISSSQRRSLIVFLPQDGCQREYEAYNTFPISLDFNDQRTSGNNETPTDVLTYSFSLLPTAIPKTSKLGSQSDRSLLTFDGN